MSLDLYVGTLTRYYTRDWEGAEPPEESTDSEESRDVRIRENGHGTLDPEDVRQEVLRWRDWMNEEVDLLRERLDWPEGDEQPYLTEPSAWESLAALFLWAAYSEHPDLLCPAELPEDWTEDPAFLASVDDEFECRYPNLLFGVDLWLPGRMDGVFDAPDTLGEDRRFGSVPALVEELRDLNARTWKADGGTLAAWRGQDFDPEDDLEPLARSALAALLPLAEKAAAMGLPLLLVD